MTSVFFDIAVPKFGRLVSSGASVTTEFASKCDIVVIRKGAKRIEVAYEPYGPPFCDVQSSEEDLRRIEVAVDFPSAERLGRGDKSSEALTALQSDLQSYVDALYPILENELR